ncbi:DUF4307 domain-containing protein [Demequina sp.]|uniref:DUF4307 domain-containing protein n=1 Tax=Demequina sp. TaxID=2050685 RepID=UPI003A895E45
MSTPHDLPELEPSGARPRLSARGWTLVGIGLAVLTAVTVWVGLAVSSQPVRWRDVGYDVVSPTETTVTFDVFLYTDAPAYCHVHAMNVQYAEVGVAEVEIDPAAGAEQRITVPIATVEEANTALVRGCGTR